MLLHLTVPIVEHVVSYIPGYLRAIGTYIIFSAYFCAHRYREGISTDPKSIEECYAECPGNLILSHSVWV